MGEDEEDDEEGRDSELQLVVPSMPSPQRKWANIYTLVAPSDVALGSLQASIPGAKISGGLLPPLAAQSLSSSLISMANSSLYFMERPCWP